MSFEAFEIAPAGLRSTKESLILAAERLFGNHGVDGVSLRQIVAAAGAANNSAVQYHFGSKGGLVQAILEYRVPQLMRRRRLLAASDPGSGLRSCMETYLVPLLELAETEGCHYLTFLEQLQGLPLRSHPFGRLPAGIQKSHADFVAEAAGYLGGIPEQLRVRRVDQASTTVLHAGAYRERARRNGITPLPFWLQVNELFDGVLGLLEAPVSEATLAALAAQDSQPSLAAVSS
jgi:AcrR family transcriptional regulator